MAGRDRRERRDRAGVGPDPDYIAGDLVRMRDLKGYDFPRGEPDIRGWEVCTLSGHHIGDVEELLVDARRGHVVLLDVDLAERAGRAEVPIRSVQLDRARKRVIVDSGELKRYLTDRHLADHADEDEVRRRARLDPDDYDLIDNDDRIR
jgi:hypothetical protein